MSVRIQYSYKMSVRIPILEQNICSVFKNRTIFVFKVLNSNKIRVQSFKFEQYSFSNF